MSETDKMPYFKMEWDDRNRYEKEMKDDPTAAAVAFVNNEKPRRNLSAYVHFIEEKRAGIKEVERLTNIWPNWPKIKEEYTRKWDFEMSETDKIPYFKMAADDKDRFEKEKKEYVLKSGKGGNGHAPCEALDDVKEEKTEEKAEAKKNVWYVFVTLLVSQASGWLKDSAWKNVLSILVTALVSQASGWLKALAL